MFAWKFLADWLLWDHCILLIQSISRIPCKKKQLLSLLGIGLHCMYDYKIRYCTNTACSQHLQRAVYLPKKYKKHYLSMSPGPWPIFLELWVFLVGFDSTWTWLQSEREWPPLLQLKWMKSTITVHTLNYKVQNVSVKTTKPQIS